MAKLIIRRWGNSAAIRLPAALLNRIGASIGDAIEVDPSALKVVKPRFKLVDLIALCDKAAPPPADVAAWDTMSPAGREIV